MAGLHLNNGQVVELYGRRYTCGGRGPGGAYFLAPHNGRSGHSIKPEAAFDLLNNGALTIVEGYQPYEGEPLPEQNFDLTALDQDQQNMVFMRLFYMRAMKAYRDDGGSFSTKALRVFAKESHGLYVAECRKKERQKPESPMSPTALRRWFKKWNESGFKTISLVQDTRGNSHTKLTTEQACMLQDAIDRDYLNNKRKPANKVHQLMVAHINVENRARVESGLAPIKAPSYQTLLRHIDRIDAFEKLKSRFNAGYAMKTTRAYGVSPPVHRHLERVQMDHTLLDLYVDFGSNILARPWLTIMLDSYSKAILGYCVTVDPPSAESVMRALRMAVMPKDMKELGGDPSWSWPMQGLPSELTLDNGKEFHGKDLELAAADLQITLNFTPPYQPWFKSQVERKFGEINTSLLSQLPGQVFKYEPEKHGLNYPHLTMDQFHRTILQWITTFALKTPNKDGKTPLELWTESVHKWGQPGAGFDQSFIEMCLAKAGPTRKVHPNGIHFNSLTFNNEWLSRLRNELESSAPDNDLMLDFKWSALDVGVIWVLDPRSKQYFLVHAKEKYAHGRSLYNHKVVLREQRNRKAAKMSDDSYTDALLALEQAVDQMTTSKKVRGKKVGAKVARFNEGRPKEEAPPPLPEPDQEEPIIEFDDELVDVTTGEILTEQVPHHMDSDLIPLGDDFVDLPDELEI